VASAAETVSSIAMSMCIIKVAYITTLFDRSHPSKRAQEATDLTASSLSARRALPNIARFPASYIDAVAADLVHQWSAVVVGAGAERRTLQESTRFGQSAASEVCQPAKLAPAIGEVFKKHSDVVVGICAPIASRP
jgi:hypothetical protein